MADKTHPMWDGAYSLKHRIGEALIDREDTSTVATTRDVQSLRFIASEAMLVNLERADLRFERRSRDSEPRRRPTRAGHAALALGHVAVRVRR